MRHLKRVAKLNKTKSHRQALFQNLANALFQHERITTTVPKAMELRRVADRLITLAKNKDLHSQRLAFESLRDKEIVKKLFTDIGDRYSAINGGYTRVLKIGNRKGDNAPMAMIELTQRKEQEKKKKEKHKETKEMKETKTPKETKKEVEKKKEPKTRKETKEKKEPKAKKETKTKEKTKVKKEPKGKKEAKAEDTETKGQKEKKPRKKKEETKEKEVK
jgi:large subunit ribosomal protein L17